MEIHWHEGHESTTNPQERILFWLPPGLNSKAFITAKQLNLAPPVFLRKAIELHAVHRNEATLPPDEYPDQERLGHIYTTWKKDEWAQFTYGTELDYYLDQLERFKTSHLHGQDPRSTDITLREVIASPGTESYMTKTGGGLQTASIQAAGVAATLELCALYEYTA